MLAVAYLAFALISMADTSPAARSSPRAAAAEAAESTDLNVLGEPLALFSTDPLTGFYRDGYCRTGPDDAGTHVVAAVVTEEFLRFTRSKGNDLETPRPEHRFPGLKPGDRWCLCALRWREALEAGVAPPVQLSAAHEKALAYVSLAALRRHAVR